MKQLVLGNETLFHHPSIMAAGAITRGVMAAINIFSLLKIKKRVESKKWISLLLEGTAGNESGQSLVFFAFAECLPPIGVFL